MSATARAGFRRGRWRGAALLAAITAGGLALRLWGLGFLLPYAGEPDGEVLVYQVARLEEPSREPTLASKWNEYPHLLAQLARLVPLPAPRLEGPAELAEVVDLASARYLRVRRLIAVLSALAVPASYVLARRFLGRGWSLFAAALTAASTLHLWYSQQARPHGVTAAAFAMALVAILRLRRRSDVASYALAGAALGLSIALLQNGAALLLSLAAAVALRERRPGAASPAWTLLALAVAAAVALPFYPASAAGDVPFLAWDGSAGVLRLNAHPIELSRFNGRGIEVVAGALWGYEPVLGALGLFALGIAAWRRRGPRAAVAGGRRADLAVVLFFALPYLGALSLYELSYQRFLMPLLPLLAILAAWGLARLAWLGARRTAISAAALALAAQVALAAGLSAVRGAPSTFDTASRWLREHAAADARIALMPTLELPLLWRPEGLEEAAARYGAGRDSCWGRQVLLGPEGTSGERFGLRFLPLQRPVELRRFAAGSDAWVGALEDDYVVVRAPRSGVRHRAATELVRALRRQRRLVHRSSPSPDATFDLTYPDDRISAAEPWIWRALRAERTGPVIEVYAR